MNSLQIIKALLSDFSEYEFKVLKKKLNTLDSQKDRKLPVLFKLISASENIELDSCIKKLYGEVNTTNKDNLRKLCERLLSKIYDSLLSENILVNDSDKFSDYYKANYRVKRGVLLFHILLSKQVPVMVLNHLLNDLTQLCDEFELFDDKSSVLKNRFILTTWPSNKNYDDYNQVLNEIELNQKRINWFIKTKLFVYECIDKVQNKSIDDIELIGKISEYIKLAEEIYSASGLINNKLDLLMLKLQYAHYEQRFSDAEMILYDIVDVVKNNKAINLKNRRAVNHMNLAYTQFFLGKFEMALKNAQLAKQDIKSSSIILNIYREAEVFALIYLKRYDEAKEVLEPILASGLTGNSPEQLSKRKLMMANICFLLKDFKGAFNFLQETKEVESDREGWNIGIRMLNIYLTLSTDKIDLADQRIGSLRKHIERTAKMRALRKRDLVIFRILSHLSRSGFDFNEVWEERQKDFKLLRSSEREYRWMPRSHELIIFDQWFESKLRGIPYDPVFPGPEAVASA